MLDIFILKTMPENVEQELGKLPNPIRKNTARKKEEHKREGGREAKYEV